MPSESTRFWVQVLAPVVAALFVVSVGIYVSQKIDSASLAGVQDELRGQRAEFKDLILKQQEVRSSIVRELAELNAKVAITNATMEAYYSGFRRDIDAMQARIRDRERSGGAR